MIVEQRVYRIRTGKLPAFLEFVESRSLPVQKPILGNLIGYFHTDIGPQSEVVHLWGYASLDERARRRAELAKNEQWKELLPELAEYIREAHNKILMPTRFSPIQ